jgi:hypothetical protein
MEQGAARRRAKELGGIAVSARKGSTGKWNIGGWPSDKDVWIVISPDKKAVLDDGGAGAPRLISAKQEGK